MELSESLMAICHGNFMSLFHAQSLQCKRSRKTKPNLIIMVSVRF